MSNAVTVIEPGTTKMTVLTCRKGQNGSLELSGLGQVGYSGVQKDGWESEKMLYHALDAALGQARKMSGCRISSCILGIPNEFCGLIHHTKEILPTHPVTRQEVLELRRLAAEYSLPAPWEISNVLYGDFLADGSPTDNPVGMSCETLGLKASVICIHTDFAKQLTKVLRSLQVQVDRWIPVPLAYGEALLTNEDREQDTVFIDTGGESTDIAVYQGGVPVFYDWIGLGGNDISRDVATGIGVSYDEAERLKRYCVLGLAASEGPEASELKMPIRNGQHIHNVPMEFLQQIVEARIEEILELVQSRIKAEGLEPADAKVVLTGAGLAMFRGIRDFSAGALGVTSQSVRLGVPDAIGLSSPALAAVYSLGHMSLNRQWTSGSSLRDRFGALLDKLKNRF